MPHKPPPLTEAQRRAVIAEIMHPLMGTAPDHEIADDLGVTPADVRRLRAILRRDLGVSRILALGRELAALNESTLTPGEWVELVLHAAVARAHRRLARHTDTGLRRSADGTMGRSRMPAEASEGVSGSKDPETTATARSRGGRGLPGHGNASGARVPG